MASLLETLRNNILSSIRGRKLGFDANEYLVGPPGLREQIEDITSTAATSAAPHGVTRVLTSGSSQTGNYTLQAPIPGIRKTLFQASTSTGVMIFTFTNAGLYLASGTSAAVIALKGQGASVDLIAMSTSQWALANGATVLNSIVQITTST